MVQHARFCRPHEACGLLGVDDEGSIVFVYALTNREASATRYRVDPAEHFHAIQHADAMGWTIGGVFHSHPAGPPVPSPIDVAEALDPTWHYFVVSGDEVKAWEIAGGSATEVDIEVTG